MFRAIPGPLPRGLRLNRKSVCIWQGLRGQTCAGAVEPSLTSHMLCIAWHQQSKLHFVEAMNAFWRVYSNCFVLGLEQAVSSFGLCRGPAAPSVREGLFVVDVAVTVWPWPCSALALISFCEKWKCECATSRWSAAWVEWPDSLKGEFYVTNITLCCMCRRLKKSLCGVMQNLEAACGGVLPCNSTVNTAAIQMMLQTCQSFCLAHLRDLF